MLDLERIKKNFHSAKRIEEDISKRSGLPSDNAIWRECRKKVEDKINACNSEADAINGCQIGRYDFRKTISGAYKYLPSLGKVAIPSSLLKYISPNILSIHAAEEMLCRSYPAYTEEIHKLSDSPLSNPRSILRKRHKRMSLSLYYQASTMFACMNYKKDIKNVCEIGAGYGMLANVWINNNINRLSNYTIIDLPEVLFDAEVFIDGSNKNINTRYILGEEDVEKLEDFEGVIFCPISCTHLLDEIHFDIIVNQGSFSEISIYWLEYWKEWLECHEKSILYSRNRLSYVYPMSNNSDYVSEAIISPIMSPLVPEEWHVTQVRAENPIRSFLTAKNVAEIFFEKVDLSNNIYSDMFNLCSYRKMSVNEYIMLAYGFIASDSLPLLYDFLIKAHDDLASPPSSLLLFARKIKEHHAYASLSGAQKAGVERVINSSKIIYY